MKGKKIVLVLGIVAMLAVAVVLFAASPETPRVINKVKEPAKEFAGGTPEILSPAKTVEEMLKAFFEERYEAIDEYYVYIWDQKGFGSEAKCPNTNTVSECLRAQNQVMLAGIKILLRVEILEEKSVPSVTIENQQYQAAVVRVKITPSGERNIILIKKDNQWKVALPLMKTSSVV